MDKFIFEPMNFINNLSYMGVGMLGIFMIVGIIMGATYLISYVTSKIGNKSED